MSAINELLQGYDAKEKAIAEEVAKLMAKKKRAKTTLTKKLIDAFNENPQDALDTKALTQHLDRNQALRVVAHVANLRNLRPEELTDDLYFMIECHSYKSKDASLATEIFKGLGTDQERLRFALFCGGMAAIYNSVPEAMAFLKERFAIDDDYSSEPNSLRYDGYIHELRQSGIQLRTTRRCHDRLDLLARSVIDLLALGYRIRDIDIFEASLKANAAYSIAIREREGEEGVFDFVLERSRWGRPSDLYTGSGDTNEDRVLDVLTYVADHHWYTDPDEED